MKTNKIFLKVKNLLKSIIYNNFAASAKASCNAFGTVALLALANALAEAA
ncbi:hypothetical protein V6525_004764 [Salmonella enterica]|nr:hypothetical protein [Salmonella enterica subsp. enterica]EEH4905848.1 hypothetical protein [Salmonella enterica]EDX0932771.1 hypothetical protein [Salmonella enterica subsp. enterica]EGB1988589.1 hypothetical protein [Salmonella enterica]EGC6171864.1 hypothetical protein [Salmonella enterica]